MREMCTVMNRMKEQENCIKTLHNVQSAGDLTLLSSPCTGPEADRSWADHTPPGTGGRRSTCSLHLEQEVRSTVQSGVMMLRELLIINWSSQLRDIEIQLSVVRELNHNLSINRPHLLQITISQSSRLIIIPG